MKKSLLLFLAALTLSFTAQAAVIKVHPSDGKDGVWADSLNLAAEGDTILMADGEYIQSESVDVQTPDVVIMAADGARPVIKAGSYLKIHKTATFVGITLDGQNTGEHGLVIRGTDAKNLILKGCEIKNYPKCLVYCDAGHHVDSLILDNCLLHDANRVAIYVATSSLADNVHGCDYFEMTNSTVYNINTTDYGAGAIDIRSNGNQTGMQNEILIDHVTLYNCQSTGDYGIVASYKSGNAKISNSIASNPQVYGSYSFRVYEGVEVSNCLWFNAPAKSGATYTNCIDNKDPLFVDAANGNFALKEGSPALGAGTDGSNLGDPRWNAPAVEESEGVTYELNGGELPKVKVPTNAELWGTDTADVNGLMHYFNHYHNLKRSAQDISADVSTNPVATFLTGMPDEAGVFVDEESKYKWLGDYIIKVTNDQIAEGKLSVLKAVDSNIKWRYGVQAFFMCLPATDSNYKGWADFTEAGKPENWGPAYQAAHAVVLPTKPVEEDYTLPIPVKEGCTFVGWYDNAEGTGKAYTVIPAGWSGTLYAIWKQGTTTALENIAVEGKAVKTIINGQLIIIKNGIQYNALGQVIK